LIIFKGGEIIGIYPIVKIVSVVCLPGQNPNCYCYFLPMFCQTHTINRHN